MSCTANRLPQAFTKILVKLSRTGNSVHMLHGPVYTIDQWRVTNIFVSPNEVSVMVDNNLHYLKDLLDPSKVSNITAEATGHKRRLLNRSVTSVTHQISQLLKNPNAEQPHFLPYDALSENNVEIRRSYPYRLSCSRRSLPKCADRY